jgi:hypothetical protein
VTARDVLWEEIVEQPEVLHRQLHAREQIAAAAATGACVSWRALGMGRRWRVGAVVRAGEG